MVRRSIVYKTDAGIEPYTQYVGSLKDREGAAKIRARVLRSEFGNMGDHQSVGRGVIELRIHFGPGYRIYIGLYGQELMVLLGAGDKSSQDKDIRKSMRYWEDYRRLNP